MKETSHWLRMNDGVRLDCTWVLPEGVRPPGGWPAVLLVHGHGDDGSKASTLDRGRRLASRGVASVSVSVRGQGASEGLSFHLGARELFDLQDVITQVTAHKDVNAGRVAVCGSSQGGWHAWMAAAHHPGVRTVVPENIFVDYADFAVSDGCLSTWFFTRTMRRRVMSAGLQELARRWAVEGHWDRLREWLRPSSPRLFADRIRCPVMVVHGWHDLGMPANDLLALLGRLTVPWRLLLGGGGHDGQDAEDAAALRTRLVDEWLDHHLLDRHSEAMVAAPPILAARRPGWEHLLLHRVEGDRSLELYLHPDGGLRSRPVDGPRPNLNLENRVRDPGYTLEAALEDDLAGTDRALVPQALCFDGAPVEQAVEVLGVARARLRVLCESTLLQVHVELWDVAGDGGATLITRGHRGLREAPVGRHLAVEVELRAIAWLLEVGHRLRLVIRPFQATWVVPFYTPWRARLYADDVRSSMISVPVRQPG